ncbi:hypothetical protein [Polyangium jinanense]|uniref:Uncharacterized protein n=1 Tax=Polyangium jinanense TaxID=2829994 RepID=A0A9X3XDS7_9BACT|nr:hypothetical protein [Polyangium jinanense]MDC3961045.1 hypothetical protein [Polyangium jinanense]MDC3987465.1 hypothetical protein [Polyangium jinanense]
MKAHTLEIEELAALVGFLNAKKLVGLDESLFRVFSEENLPRLVAKLNEHGWLTPAERPGTYHFKEDLMQALAVAVAPEFAVLARSEARAKSIVFYLAGSEITEIVLTADRAVVARIENLDEMAAQVVTFLQRTWPGEIAVARVKGESFDAGRRVTIDAQGTLTTKTPGLLPGNTWSAENVTAFLHGALAELRAPRG